MRIRLLIAVLMMHSVDGNPPCWTVLQVAHPQDCQRPLKPNRAGESTMRQQAMVTNRDPKHSENEMPSNTYHQPRPSEEPRRKCQQCDDVHQDENNGILPLNLERHGCVWGRNLLRICRHRRGRFETMVGSGRFKFFESICHAAILSSPGVIAALLCGNIHRKTGDSLTLDG